MPKYIIFLIVANRLSADETKDDNEITKTPYFQKTMQEFLAWIKTEIEAERIKGGDTLLESSEDTNIRIDFREPDKAPEAEIEKNDGVPAVGLSNSSVTRGHQPDMSTNILGFYTAEFPTVNDVIAWARSCPIAYDGFALEIRQLKDLNISMIEATPDVKEWVGDHIVSARKQLLEKGKMRKEEDGTQWVKLEDEDWVKEIVSEAEERRGEKGQD